MEQAFSDFSASPPASGEIAAGIAVSDIADNDPVWPSLPASVVKSAGRALQILEYFDDTRGPANMVDVSRALGYPESSTSILLRSLVTLGYLDYDRFKRTYHPTGRVRLLGNWIDPKLFDGDAVVHLMARVNSESSDTVILAARNGLNVQYIHVVQARTALRLHLTTGTMRPIAKSAVGYVLLSQMHDLEVAKLVRRINADASGLEDMIKVSDVLQHVSRIREKGHIFVNSKITPGTSILAMPLPVEFTLSPLVIAIGGPTERMEARESELVALLTRCISEELRA